MILGFWSLFDQKSKITAGVGAGDEAAQHVAPAGDRGHLEHLGDGVGVCQQRRAGALPDLERRERRDPVSPTLSARRDAMTSRSADNLDHDAMSARAKSP